ncbi:MAG: NADH-quinone oxidoreductase subunit L [Chloroflexaceae bacterium]|nr:NADH-quinone oxidoreductase subunit L [Chloroflexaceae bacterium]
MAFFLHYAWLIPVFPLLSFAIISLTPIRRSKPASGWLAIGLMGVATLFALGVLAGVAQGGHPAEDAQEMVVQPGEHATTSADESAGEHAPAAAEGDHAAAGAAEEHAEHATGFAFPEPVVVQRVDWAPTGTTTFRMGIYLDAIAALTLVMVTLTSTCIHLFSMGYMSAHPRHSRFFSFISLFTAAMLGMVMADNLLLFFICWEIMGLCSYLLIGFLFERPQANRAANKAFITTRIGDVLMLAGMVYLYTQVGSLAFGMGEGEIFNAEVLARLSQEQNALGMSHAVTISLLLFAGTVGKSAQFPLHVWLPDAMEGPTPVSALIHAATMVSAGVFLVGRTFPLFAAGNGEALTAVSTIGAFTALFAATIAVAQFDIKRILAYSTLSQLGFMVAALGIGGWVAGMFHMLTHAFFKALLFLGSGSIIHAVEETQAIAEIHHHDEYAAQQTAQDIRNMGNLRKYMPWTFWTYTMGFLALAGIFPFAGFWSKDEILADAQNGHLIVYVVLSVAAFLTAFYMTRQWRVVFFGRYRGEKPLVFVNPEGPAPATPHHAEVIGAGEAGLDIHLRHHDYGHEHDDDQAHDGEAPAGAHGHGTHGGHHLPAHPHESPWTIVAPLVVLAFFAVTLGAINLPFDFSSGHWLSHLVQQHAAEFNVLVAGLSLVIAVAGIGAGWFYASAFKTAQDSDPLARRMPAIFGVLNQKYYVDEFYALTVGKVTSGLALAWRWIDRQVFDRILHGTGTATLFWSRVNFILDDFFLNDGPDSVGKGTITTGKQVRRVQTGKVQDYLGLVFAGVVVLGLVYLYRVGR